MQRMGKGWTCSSSSVMLSPSSLATRFKFLKLILPVSSSSNSLNACSSQTQTSHICHTQGMFWRACGQQAPCETSERCQRHSCFKAMP